MSEDYTEEDIRRIKAEHVAKRIMEGRVCSVCGPPVMTWWPVHFLFCSNQNSLAVRGVTLAKTVKTDGMV